MRRKAIILAFLFICFICLISCSQVVENKHVHSWILNTNGTLKCTGCDDTITTSYFGVLNGSSVENPFFFSDGIYKNHEAGKTVVIYTTGEKLTIDAPNDTIRHYGSSSETIVKSVSDATYHCLGHVTTLRINAGAIDLQNPVPQVFVDATSNVSLTVGKDSVIYEMKLDASDNVSIDCLVKGEIQESLTVESNASVKLEANAKIKELVNNAEETRIEVKESSQIHNLSGSGKTVAVDKSGAGIELHSHVFEQETIVKEPTCEETGLKVLKCSCGEEKEVSIDALGHDYVFSSEKAPTCTENGYKVYVCKNDNTHTYTETLLALGHDYVFSSEKAPTCTENGYKVYVCKNDNTHTYTETLLALGHDFVGKVCSRCNLECTHSFDSNNVCTKCGFKAKEHNISFVTGNDLEIGSQTVLTDRTVTEPSVSFYNGKHIDGWYVDEACENKYDFAEKVEKDITLYAKWSDAEVTIKKAYFTNKTSYTKSAYFEWDNPDFEGFDHLVFFPEGFSWASSSGIEVSKDNTSYIFSYSGSLTNITIAVVDEKGNVSEGITPDIKDHTHSYSQEVIPATCTQGTITKNVCDCGYSYNYSFGTDTLGHDWILKEVLIPATKTTEGKELQVCSRCGETQEVVTPIITTNISGIISDLHWTKEKSPYRITEKALVEEGSTLIIDPGVRIIFDDGSYLQINGELLTNGTSDEMIEVEGENSKGFIYKNGNEVSFSGSEDELEYVSGNRMDYVKMVGFMECFFNGSIWIENCEFILTNGITRDNYRTGSSGSGQNKQWHIVYDKVMRLSQGVIINCIFRNSFNIAVGNDVHIINSKIFGSAVFDGVSSLHSPRNNIFFYNCLFDGSENSVFCESHCGTGVTPLPVFYNCEIRDYLFSAMSAIFDHCTLTGLEPSAIIYFAQGLNYNTFTNCEIEFLKSFIINNATINYSNIKIGDECEILEIQTNSTIADFQYNHWYNKTSEFVEKGENSNISFFVDYYDDFDKAKALYSGWELEPLQDIGSNLAY